MAIRYWLVVQPLDRARALVDGGFVQLPWGVRDGLEEMRELDGVVVYSPRTRNPDGDSIRCFVAAGRVADDEPWRAGSNPAAPWRRAVDWLPEAVPAPVRGLRDALDLTRDDRYWGERLRDGWLEITRRDFDLVEDAVRRRPPEPSRLAMGLPRR